VPISATSFTPTSSTVPTNGLYLPAANSVALSTNGTEKLRITSGGELNLPAGIGSQIRFENQHSVTTDAAISTFDDSSGTLVCLGSNFYFNSAGSETRYNTSEESAAIVLNRNGEIDLRTGDTTLSASSRLRIDSSGRLLVGTSSASADVRAVIAGTSSSATAGGQLRIQRGSANPQNAFAIGSLSFSDSNEAVGASIGAFADGSDWAASDYPTRLVFSTTADGAASPTERMRIDSAGYHRLYGNLGVLRLASNATANGFDPLIYGVHTATSTTTGTQSFSVWTNGNVVNTNNSYGPISSDERLKQDIVDAGTQWDDIKAVRLTKFRYKNDPTGELHLGPIAQELEQVSPGLITRRPASEDEIADPSNDLVDGDEVLSFKASILYMKAVKALQEAMERIETLEAKVAALEAQ